MLQLKGSALRKLNLKEVKLQMIESIKKFTENLREVNNVFTNQSIYKSSPSSKSVESAKIDHNSKLNSSENFSNKYSMQAIEGKLL